MTDHDSSFDYPSSPPEKAGWLLSYADLITLLLTFFIILLSISTMQLNRFDLLKAVFSEQHTGDLTELKKKLDRFITEEGIAQTVSTRLDMDGLDIQFTNTVLFDSAKAEMNPQGHQLLDKILAFLVDLDPRYSLVIEGYTDDLPIHTAAFRSNWELSAGRAIQVLTAMLESGIDRNRLSIQGFADTRPAVPIDSTLAEQTMNLEERRSLNRRVVIRVY